MFNDLFIFLLQVNQIEHQKSICKETKVKKEPSKLFLICENKNVFPVLKK